MVIDDGLPSGHVQDVLATGAAYIDLMKIKTGTARLYERKTLVDRLALYKAHQIRPFLGGQFHEYVFVRSAG